MASNGKEQKMRRIFPVGKKVYFIDTSVIMHDPSVVERLSSDNNVVVLSVCVLAELDKAKKFQDEKGVNARTVSRLLDEYRSCGSLNEGVKTKRDGVIVVDCNGTDKSFKRFMPGIEKINDNRIIATALQWKADSGTKYEKIAVISKDINFRIMANAFGIDAEDYESDKNIQTLDELYTGFAKLSLCEPDLITEIYQKGFFQVSLLSKNSQSQINVLFPNQCLELEVDGKTVLAIFKKAKGILECVKKPKLINEETSKRGKLAIAPRNVEQALAYRLLMDPSISLVALSGTAGTGKTLLALSAAFEQLGTQHHSIRVYRPNEEIGNKVGFLPGDLGDKFAPWMEPIFDNFRVIIKEDDQGYGKPDGKSGNKMTIAYLMERGMLEISPLNFVRGRSIGDSFMIVDEAQNITPKLAKTILTRAGEGTKVVLTGDCSQIDTPYLDSISNGLTHVIERFKGQEIFGTITLRQGERSEFSKLVAQLL